MQIKNNLSNYLQKPRFLVPIKVLILVACGYFLHEKLSGQMEAVSAKTLPLGTYRVVAVVMALALLNWYLEIVRWKISIARFENISFREASTAVLGGLALNWLLPFTSGDWVARLIHQRDKYQSTSALLLNRGIMLALTLLLGIYGLSYFATSHFSSPWLCLILLPLIPLLAYLFKKSLSRFWLYFQKIDRWFLLRLVFLSIFRYLVFVFQFYVLLRLFLPGLPPGILLAGIGWIFLVRSMLPLLLGGIGVREASGLLFFQIYTSDFSAVIVPIFIIWVINTVVPSLVGFVFVWKFRLNIVE